MRGRHRGFTLLEILVVIALIGLMLGIAVPMVGDLMDYRVKAGARRLAATIQYLYGKAATQRLMIRLVYDLDKRSYWAESSRDRFALLKEGPETEKAREEEEEKRSEEKEAPGDSEKPAEGSFTAEEGLLVQPTSLPDGVLFKDVYALHQEKPLESGQAATYFFPGGMVEWSLINLTEEGEEIVYGLEVQPMTGRVSIQKKYLDYRELGGNQSEE